MSNGMPNSSTRPEFKERRENVTLQKSIQFAPKHLPSFLSRSSGNQGFLRSARQIPDKQKIKGKANETGGVCLVTRKVWKINPKGWRRLCSLLPFMFNSPGQQLLGLPQTAIGGSILLATNSLKLPPPPPIKFVRWARKLTYDILHYPKEKKFVEKQR